MYKEIEFRVNGNKVVYSGDPLTRLVDVLRDDLRLTGPVGACLGSDILTIEGIRDTEKGKCLIDAFRDGGAVQCGFCIPGMVMAAYALLKSNPNPTERDVRIAISGNICRCTGYDLIVESILLAASRGGELWQQ